MSLSLREYVPFSLRYTLVVLRCVRSLDPQRHGIYVTQVSVDPPSSRFILRPLRPLLHATHSATSVPAEVVDDVVFVGLCLHLPPQLHREYDLAPSLYLQLDAN